MVFWKSNLAKPPCLFNAIRVGIERKSWWIEIHLPVILLPQHRQGSRSISDSRELLEDLLLESLQVLVSSYFEKCKGQWHQESASPTQPVGRRVKRTFPVCNFYKNEIFVYLIGGENCWPSAADLALCQSPLSFSYSPWGCEFYYACPEIDQ